MKDSELLSFYCRRDYLTIVDKTLVSDEKIVILCSLRPDVLRQLHITHPGIRRMMQLVRRYWSAMHANIEKYVKNYKHCAETASNPIKEPFHP